MKPEALKPSPQWGERKYGSMTMYGMFLKEAITPSLHFPDGTLQKFLATAIRSASSIAAATAHGWRQKPLVIRISTGWALNESFRE